MQLSTEDIHLAVSAADKQQAVRLVANALVQAGCVAAGYVDGMLIRETQTSTYLGKGIAIPHGTTDTRDQVLKTGVQVFQFPEGVDWGDGQIVWLVIGIAARSDEHLELLRHLTHVLSDDLLAEQVKSCTSAQVLCDLLSGKRLSPQQIQTFPGVLKFTDSLLSLSVDASDLLTLQVLNAGRLKVAGAVDATFINHVISHDPVNLGQGIWLNDSPTGNICSAIAISRPAVPFSHPAMVTDAPVSAIPTSATQQTVAMLITVAVVDSTPEPSLNRLSQLLATRQVSQLLSADAASLLALLSETVPPVTNSDESSVDDGSISGEFVIHNAHGLHARPGAMLVNTIKQFSSTVTVANINGDGKVVNGRSLMKVVSLGVKHGHTLRFNACGDDAREAIVAIGEAIQQGLGESLTVEHAGNNRINTKADAEKHTSKESCPAHHHTDQQ